MRLRLNIGVVLVLGELVIGDIVTCEGKLLLGRLVAPVAVREESRRHGDEEKTTKTQLQSCERHARTSEMSQWLYLNG